ncbi:MAG: beta-eliminating lyase-related protein [Actinomycetota bacterium]|nr:beta-eliminating lyase-related protein [Actinomycetota bacterium]
MTADDRLRAGCSRSLSLYAPQNRNAAATMRRWGAMTIEADVYGAGGAVTAVEHEVAALLGKPAAVFMPTGTMAQQIALRIHAERRDSRTVAFHPLCHLERHEERAYEHLHGLVGQTVGEEHRLIDVADLESVPQPLAALVLELPQRMIGAQLPSWEELIAQTEWARARGAARHLDGARLWEAQPFYERPHAQIADLFDTVYVSFYKGLGGIGGCVLAGPEDVIELARVWRIRHGGELFALWPYAVDALYGLRVELPLMAQYWRQAKELAAELAVLTGVRIVPDPPQTPIFNVILDRAPEAVRRARSQLAATDDVWLFDRMWPTDPPDRTRIEIAVGAQLGHFSSGEIAALIGRLRDLSVDRADR